MNDTFQKFKFLIKKKPVVVVTGEGKKLAEKAIASVLKGKDVFIAKIDDKKMKNFEFFLKFSPRAVLVVTHVGEIPFDRDYFAGEKEQLNQTIEIAKKMTAKNWLVLNYDDETVREINDITNLNTLTFGFSEKADFWVSDIKLNHGINFKINYKGKIVPIWLKKTFGKEQIYSALVAAAVGTIFSLNLVEISQLLKDYETLPGKMRLVDGIKSSFILDDTESASVFSMIEAIEILGKVPEFKRKIAVLGDIVGIGKYTIQAHQAIGEKIIKNADLLFTFGPRAKFIAKGASEKGMSYDQIFSFERIEEGIDKLREIIKPGDLILVDGSKEIKMSEIVDRIRKIW